MISNIKLFELEKFDNQALIEPYTISAGTEDNKVFRLVDRSAAKRIYSQIGINGSLSKQIFKISSDIWEAVINMKCMEPNKNRDNPDAPFDIREYSLVSSVGEMPIVFDITNMPDAEQRITNFHNFILANSARVYIYGDVYKIYIGPDINDSDAEGKPIVMIDLDNNNSRYELYTGVIKYGCMILSEKPIVKNDSLISFIGYDFEREVVAADKMASAVYDNIYNENHTNLSARETIDMLKSAVLDIRVDNGVVCDIGGIIYDGDISDIVDSLNSYDLPYETLKKMTYLRKSLKRDPLTIHDILTIFSRNYFTFQNMITARTLSDIIRISSQKAADRNVINSELGTN